MNAMLEPARVEALRNFNRFYTRRLGVLGAALPGGAFTLAESRLLWELAHHPDRGAAQLARELALDLGYVSRIVTRLRERGLLKTSRSRSDGRLTLLALSAAGKRAFAKLDQGAQAQMAALLAPLAEPAREQLVAAANRMLALLGAPAAAPLQLRAPRPGDLGWVVSRHGALYAQEYGWDQRFEALVAQIVARYVERFDATREAGWMAERAGLLLGCVFLVQQRDAADAPEPGVAQLRLLLVDPAARGSGLGRQLVQTCTRFARQHGYQRIRLWTNSLLGAARHLYEQEGYRLTASEAHRSFGHDLVGETWELAL